MDEKPVRAEREVTRDERRKAALRANLQRRKAQARARDQGPTDGSSDDKKES